MKLESKIKELIFNIIKKSIEYYPFFFSVYGNSTVSSTTLSSQINFPPCFERNSITPSTSFSGAEAHDVIPTEEPVSIQERSISSYESMR